MGGIGSVHVLPLSPETLEIIKKNAPISVPKPDFPADDPTIEIDVEYETSDNLMTLLIKKITTVGTSK